MEITKLGFSVSYEVKQIDFIKVGGKGIMDNGNPYGGSIKIRLTNMITIEDEHLGTIDREEELIIRINTESKDNDDEVAPLNKILRDIRTKGLVFTINGGIPKNFNGENTVVAFENCKQLSERLFKLADIKKIETKIS
ncbi:MAG: hypothetical protein AB7E13_04790 [Arcobacteraceae bacterium]